MPKRSISGSAPVAAIAAQNGTDGRDAEPPEPSPTPADQTEAGGAGDQGPVVIEGPGVDPIEIHSGPGLMEAAQEWQRIVRSRVRWSSSPDARNDQAERSKQLLASLGVHQGQLERIAESGVAQVSVPYVRETDGWDERIFPWEYVLSSATRDHCARPLVVVRRIKRLRGAQRDAAAMDQDPTLIVESAPGVIRSQFFFDSERQLVRAALGEGVRLLPDPTVIQLEDAVRTCVPAAIHLSGVDSHQGSRVLGLVDRGWDGYFLANDRGQPSPVEAQRLGHILAAAPRKPMLVACNFENSAARVAAMAVAEGAAAAVGFQDSVDDGLAELFFSRFYANWAAGGQWATVAAFVRTIDDLRSKPGVLTGLGIVLWSDEDIVADGTAARIGRDRSIWTAPSSSALYSMAIDDQPIQQQTQVSMAMRVPQGQPSGAADTGDPPDAVTAEVSATVQTGAPPSSDEESDARASADDSRPAAAKTTIAPLPDGAVDGHAHRTAPSATLGRLTTIEDAAPERLVAGQVSDVREPPAVWAEPKVRENVNFVRLHNNGSLFDTFRLHKSMPGDVPVDIEVTLFVGRHSFPYKATRKLSQPVTELRDEIRVPLTADLLRTVHETIQTVVYVRVRQGHLTIHEDTMPVWIASVDEWMDTDDETRWLPSFVLPSDPAIDQVRQRSLPALRALDDTFGGGFLGYQALGPDDANPRYKKIDVQANAIWSTLSFLYELSYVNPPPTYTEHAQRLRTPTEVTGSQSGTCIDLALLFAACLEAIDIYPVILMYEGHANVGYWRSPAFHEAFQTLQVAHAKPARKPRKRNWSPKDRTTGRKEADPGAAAYESHDVQADSWELQRQVEGDDANLDEVIRRIDRQDLAVIETTMLTEQAGFGDALRGGQDSFRTHAFRSLVDVRIARKARVTPLPIRLD